jgi:hypothetical protein
LPDAAAPLARFAQTDVTQSLFQTPKLPLGQAAQTQCTLLTDKAHSAIMASPFLAGLESIIILTDSCGAQSMAGYCGNLWFHLPAAAAITTTSAAGNE